MKFHKNNSPGYLANHMARLFAARLQERLSPEGLSTGQFPTLLALYEKDGQTQSELVAQLDVEQATLANTLKRMERDGLVRRTPHPDDGRARIIQLTEKSLALRDTLIHAARETNQMAMSELSDKEKRTFITLAQRVIGTLKADEA